MDTRTAPGDIYVMDANDVQVHGSEGIALRLNQRNLSVMAEVKKTFTSAKDVDIKERRFVVGYDSSRDEFRFDIIRGGQVRAKAWQFSELLAVA